MVSKAKTTATLFAALIASAVCFQATAQITRADAPESSRTGHARCVPVPKGLEKKLRSAEKSSSSGLRFVNSSNPAPRLHTNSSISPRAVNKVNAKATDIQGFSIYREGAGDAGWFKVAWPSDNMLWKRPSDYSPTAGFVRGSDLYAFYSLSNEQGIIDAGIAIHDLASGTVKDYIQLDIFDSVEQVTYACAYDPTDDVAYLATYNASGTGMILQKFDPVTHAYTPLGVKIPPTILDMGWNPSDNAAYILDETGALMRYDSKAKKFSTVANFSYNMTDYPNDMVYSPKDDAFFALLDSYDDEGNPCTDAVLLDVNGKLSYLGTIANNPQYSILHISDRYVNADAAKAPVLKGWNIAGAATAGSLSVTLPTKYENGKTLQGTVYVEASIDGNTLQGTLSGAAGSDITINFNSTEGLHSFKITPFTLTDDGRLYGTPLVVNKFLGLDHPAAPANVRLSDSSVSWDAVTTGANDGYINAADVKYTVYIDGVKMNQTPVSATRLDITIPSTGTVAHRASVVAVSGGKESEPGSSAKYYTDGPLPIPVCISPDEGERDLDPELIDMFTVVKDPLNKEELRGWRYDDQSEQTGGFYCLAPLASSSGDTADEWLFLPAVHFPDKDAHYRFSMEVWSGNHYFTSDENYEVYISKTPSKSRATLIREEDTVYKGHYFELSETFFQVPEAGDYYIGIRYTSPLGAYRLYAKDFRIEKSAASPESPAAVTSLSATAADRGRLSATLSFIMPSVSINGSALDPSEVITATASSAAGSNSIEGTPGQKVTLEVPTTQGDNIISVTTSSAKGDGLTAQVIVYTGVYRPGMAIVDRTVSDDNQTLTLHIDIDDFNENDEFVDPDNCDVTIYRKINSEWRVAAEIGKNRTWDFVCPDPSAQDLYQFGVAAKNAVGYSEEMASFGVHLGKLYTLPMEEKFPSRGSDVSITYEPISIEHLSYLPGDWGFCDPTDVDEAAANESGVALYATWEADTQAILPRFSTKGMHNAKLDLSLFFGNKSPESITVFASSPAIEMEPIASFSRNDGSGWEHKLVSLPAVCQNQGWVQIIIRVNLKGYSQFFLLDGYSVANYPENMATISAMSGPARAALGDRLSYKATVENAGTKEMAMPAYEFIVLGDNGVAANLKDDNAPASIAAGDKVELSFSFVPKAADRGNLLARFSIEGQPDVAVSEMETATTLINAPVPTVDDLSGTVTSDLGVNLTWSTPSHKESFEAFEPWDFSEDMRGFRNLDLDGGDVWSIAELNYPGKFEPKAFQIITGKGADNPLLQAHSGEYYLMCLSAKKGISDDWFISPEIKGGSSLSFWMNICDPDYPETVLVKYSTSGREPSDFRDLDGGYVCPDERQWTRYDFTLPADAKYFALNHVGDDGQEQFGLMIDDISFSPVDALPAESYNVYRNHELIASGITSTGYTDTGANPDEPVLYTVKTVSTVNGEKVESDRSNAFWIDISGVDSAICSEGSVRAEGRTVVLEGFAAGSRFAVVNAAGIAVASGEISSDKECVTLSAGVYVVDCRGRHTKVIIR